MDITFRSAERGDLRELIDMLAHDELGQGREDPGSPINQAYLDAFEHIAADPNNDLISVVAEGRVIGMLQLTFIPYLTHTGSWRCLVEGVRVHQDYRGGGIGTRIFEWAIDRARQQGCTLIQLTSDKRRPKALQFYKSLGFVDSHEGFKLAL